MDQKSAEFQALRETIRQRGTVRVALVPLIFAGWAAAAIATAGAITLPISTLIPLMVLVAGFEAVFALHMNVERIGRYLQVFHEEHAAGWESVATAFSQRFPSTGPDPLFTQVFVFAISVNYLSVVMWHEHAIELIVLAALHLAAVYRIRMARTTARRQRKEDIERFTALRDS